MKTIYKIGFQGFNNHPRLENLLRSFDFYLGKEYIIRDVDSIESFRDNKPSDNDEYVVLVSDDLFVHDLTQCNEKQIESFLQCTFAKKRFIYIGLGDLPCPSLPYKEMDKFRDYISFFMFLTGRQCNMSLRMSNLPTTAFPFIMEYISDKAAWVNDKSISLYGYLDSRLNRNVVKIIPFEDKINKISFIGSLYERKNSWRHTTLDILSRYNIKKDIGISLVWLAKLLVPNEIIDYFTQKDGFYVCDRMEIDEYYRFINESKFSIAPWGLWHSYRFLESLSVGSLCLTSHLDDLDLIGNFRNGVNYLSLGIENENFDEVMDIVMNDPNTAKQIADSGLQTYNEYFVGPVGKVLPSKTFNLILSRMNEKMSEEFFSTGFNLNQSMNRS